MAKHIISPMGIGLWVMATLLVGVYVPSLVSSNLESDDEGRYCALERNRSPAPTRVWAIELPTGQQPLIAGI